MASELILVNISNSPMTVSLPTGRPVIILPGFGVAGDYFVKYMQVGVLMPIAAIPSSFKVRGVSEPLRSEGVRTSGEPSSNTSDRPQTFRDTKKVAVKSTMVALEERGEGTSNEAVAAAHNVAVSEADLLDGITREAWVTRVQSISDTTLAQQMKLDQLRNLARFLNIDSADVLSTKSDLISAVRIRCRG